MRTPQVYRRQFALVTGMFAAALVNGQLLAEPPSPTGTIAFVRGHFGGMRKIWLIDADGKNLRPLTDVIAQHAWEDRPSWSPDGKRVAFTQGKSVVSCTEDGQDLKVLTPDDLDAAHPSWSPDGTAIVFHAWNDDRSRCSIHTMNSDGTNIKKLVHWRGYHWMPHWSPAGNRIVYESLMSNNREVFTIAIDGTDVKNLSRDHVTDHAPSYSPSGKQIAFMSGRFGKNAEICVMNADGRDVVNLTNNPLRDSEPAWSPDGQWIAFTRTTDEEGEPMNIFVMRSDGSEPVNLTNSVGDIDNWAPAWR